MPLVSQFYGILIYIYSELSGQHNAPHFHAKYAEYEGSFDFDGNCLAGDLPTRQRKFVEVWALIHSDELKAAWTAWNEDGELIKIDGLK